MKETEIVELFRQKHFRATPQRIAVYKYLAEHPTHPDADEIYKVLIKESPSFSKTTVYNALQSLEECGLIIKIQSTTTVSDKLTQDCTDTSSVTGAKKSLTSKLTE